MFTFRVRHSQGEIYIGHGRLCVCLCVCLSVPGLIPTLLHGPGCNLGNGRGCRLVVHYWTDLQSMHGFHCYDNIAPNAKCQRVLVLALCLVVFVIKIIYRLYHQYDFAFSYVVWISHSASGWDQRS